MSKSVKLKSLSKGVVIVSKDKMKKNKVVFFCNMILFITMLNSFGCASLSSKEIFKGNFEKKHHLEGGTFKNRFGSSISKPFADLIKWWWEGENPEPVDFELSDNDPQFLKKNREKNTLTWIGHSTLLIQYNGINILTDPHLTKRASPLSFVGPKRYTPPGLSIEELPDIDIIIISHNHYDHLDKLTIEKIFKKQLKNPPHVFVPLRLKKWFEDLEIGRVTELDWDESKKFEEWVIHAVPVHHWSMRSPWDRNKTLWAGWVLETKGFRFFFAGDTGYSRDFENLAKNFGQFDLSAIPIGGYEPRWFMKAAHVNPEEAVKIHKDINSRFSIGIHWGTFILTDEPVEDPPKILQIEAKKSGLKKNEFFVMKHGETRSLDFLKSIN